MDDDLNTLLAPLFLCLEQISCPNPKIQAHMIFPWTWENTVLRSIYSHRLYCDHQEPLAIHLPVCLSVTEILCWLSFSPISFLSIFTNGCKDLQAPKCQVIILKGIINEVIIYFSKVFCFSPISQRWSCDLSPRVGLCE